MSESAGRNTQDVYATTAEIMAAIESLSAEEDYRLKRFALYRVRGLGRAGAGASHLSLLGEAVASTLQGAEDRAGGRKWAKNRVAFVEHLLGAMLSISSHWKEAYERRGLEAEELDCEAATLDESGKLIRPVEHAVDPTADPYRSRAANEVLEMLDKRFAGDEDALLVIEGLKEGMTVPAMVADLKLPEKKVKAAVQRVRYFMEGLR